MESSWRDIERAVKSKSNGYPRDQHWDLNNGERIVEAIEWLTQKFPKRLIPIVLLYWMTNPGHRQVNTGSDDYQIFRSRLFRQKKAMKTKYKRSFFVEGQFFRGYVSAEEHAAYEVPKSGRNLVVAFNKANLDLALVGDVSKLKVGAELSQEQKDGARAFSQAVHNIGQSIKGLLGPGTK